MRNFDNLKKFILPLLSLLFLASSCRKPIDPPDDLPGTNPHLKGIYILNEGLFNMNNSTISYLDFENDTRVDDIFLRANNRGLGDTGNDLHIYGSKLYCVVNRSEVLEIMKANDCKSVKQISLQGKQPRKIVFHREYAYVSCFNGDIMKIDTATLEITDTKRGGRNPEGMCVARNKLYVANSGGLDNPNYGRTVSVFDLDNFSLMKNIEVEINPSALAADHQGDVYLVSKGNYDDIPYTFQRINSSTDEVVQVFDLPVLNLTISGNLAYLYSYDFNSRNSWIKVMDITTEQIVKENFISDGTAIRTPYGIKVDPVSGDVYITDANQFTVKGDVYCFDKNGKKKFVMEAGLNPSMMVMIPRNQYQLTANK